MKKEMVISLLIAGMALILAIMTASGILSRDIFIPIVLMLIGAVNIINGFIYAADGQGKKARAITAFGVFIILLGFIFLVSGI